MLLLQASIVYFVILITLLVMVNPAEYPSITSITYTPSPTIYDEANLQYMQVTFSPVTTTDSIQDNINTIIDVLDWITKIDASYWSAPYGSWSWYDTTVDINYIYTDFVIESNSTETESKLQTFKAWLDYDKEQFITLFNTHSDMEDLAHEFQTFSKNLETYSLDVVFCAVSIFEVYFDHTQTYKEI